MSRANETIRGVVKIGEALELAKQYDVQVVVFIKARDFGSGKCTSGTFPSYARDSMTYLSGPSGNKACVPMFWKSEVMDRFIALFNEIGRRYDSHPNLEVVMEGETTLSKGPGYSNAAYDREMKRLITEGKKALPSTMIVIQMNFYDPDERSLLNHMVDVGGMAFGLPDTVTCRIPDASERNRIAAKYDARNSCGYTISNYKLMREYADKLAITPNAETYDLKWNETEASYRTASEYMLADHFFMQESFCSRVDGGCRNGYVESQLLPTFKRVGNIMHPECPSSFGTCIENDGAIEHVGSGGGGATAEDNGAVIDTRSETPLLLSDSCHLFKSNTYLPPTGFGAVYFPFLTNSPIFIQASCAADEDGAFGVFMDGSSAPGVQYVWDTGYMGTPGGVWEEVPIIGEQIPNNSGWINAEASAASYAYAPTEEIRQQTHLFLAYVCTWYNDTWKCGCRDAACTESFWQLQAFRLQNET